MLVSQQCETLQEKSRTSSEESWDPQNADLQKTQVKNKETVPTKKVKPRLQPIDQSVSTSAVMRIFMWIMACSAGAQGCCCSWNLVSCCNICVSKGFWKVMLSEIWQLTSKGRSHHSICCAAHELWAFCCTLFLSDDWRSSSLLIQVEVDHKASQGPVRHDWEVEMSACCSDPVSVGCVVTAASILVARKSGVGISRCSFLAKAIIKLLSVSRSRWELHDYLFWLLLCECFLFSIGESADRADVALS